MGVPGVGTLVSAALHPSLMYLLAECCRSTGAKRALRPTRVCHATAHLPPICTRAWRLNVRLGCIEAWRKFFEIVALSHGQNGVSVAIRHRLLMPYTQRSASKCWLDLQRGRLLFCRNATAIPRVRNAQASVGGNKLGRLNSVAF
jgi:hypothetical protein